MIVSVTDSAHCSVGATGATLRPGVRIERGTLAGQGQRMAVDARRDPVGLKGATPHQTSQFSSRRLTAAQRQRGVEEPVRPTAIAEVDRGRSPGVDQDIT